VLAIRATIKTPILNREGLACTKEAFVSEQILRLVYPVSLLSVPIINQLIRRYDLTVNILRAQIGGEDRWMEVQLSGNPVVIDDAITWLKELGIEIQYK